MVRQILVASVLLSMTAAVRTGGGEPVVVHEWGTFTSLQDEQGAAVGRINTDDEPVPGFVHQVVPSTLFSPTAAFTTDAKGVPAGDPNVTMRLETPVIYFHLPPPGERAPVTLSVEVAFHGGWLTQYFPDARAVIPGAPADPAMPLPALSAKTVGRLSWPAITLNARGAGRGEMPETSDRVWTAPRAVESAAVTAGAEREQFLFYRGVGNLDAPLRVVRKEKELEVRPVAGGPAIGKMWLVDIQANGRLAFRAVLPGAAGGAVTPAEFSAREYGRGNLASLRAALHEALTGEGLFSDEADALLNTWERSYFQNPGERLFFMVPQSWTDEVMPLTLSVPAKVTRVMVGRIELITPAQRALLHRMALAAPFDSKAIKDATAAMSKLRNDPARSAAYNALAGGHGNLSDLGVEVPAVYADFLALGRFRTALVFNSREGPLVTLAGMLVP